MGLVMNDLSAFVRRDHRVDPIALAPSPARRVDAAPVTPSGLRGLLSPDAVRSGYAPRSELVDAVFNRGLALLILALASPLMAFIWLTLRLSSRDPVLYRGARIGKDGVPFDILKFRTLALHAQSTLARRTLPRRTSLETRLGSYLRKSRLDELPQLLNILRGEMVFFGPRPVREEMLPVYRAQVPDLDIRFTVRPGLLGLTQALMPHSAGKRDRGRFNAMCCRAPVHYGFVLSFAARVGWHVLRRGAASAIEALRDLRSPLGAHTFLRSGFVTGRDMTLEVRMPDGGIVQAGLVGMSDEVVQFVSTLPVTPGPYRMHLRKRLRRGRHAAVTVDAEVRTVGPIGLGQSGFVGFAVYDVISEASRYRIERYFLDQTVIPA